MALCVTPGVAVGVTVGLVEGFVGAGVDVAVAVGTGVAGTTVGPTVAAGVVATGVAADTVAYGVAAGNVGEGNGTAVPGGVCSLGVGGSVNPGGPKSFAVLVGRGDSGAGGDEEGTVLAEVGAGVRTGGGGTLVPGDDGKGEGGMACVVCKGATVGEAVIPGVAAGAVGVGE